MIRALVAAFATFLSFSVCAQNITPEGTARVISLHFYVAELCSKYYTVDRDLAFQYALASAEIGNKMVGIKPFGQIAKKETQRRAQEIKITGEAQWCVYQRANLNQSGSAVFLN